MLVTFALRNTCAYKKYYFNLTQVNTKFNNASDYIYV